VYIPKDRDLKVEIIWLHHDALVAGHGRLWKMVELVTRNYWWPRVTRDIRRYMEGYDSCQRMKNRTEEIAEKLKLSNVPEKLWTHIMVNFITKLLVVAGKNAILVVYNRLSKMMHFMATTKGTSVEGLARLFRDNVWKLHRLLESIVVKIIDGGLYFIFSFHFYFTFLFFFFFSIFRTTQVRVYQSHCHISHKVMA